MTSHIKLYGSKGLRFEQIKEEMTMELGYEPSNPEVVGLLMAAFEPRTASTTNGSLNLRRVELATDSKNQR